LSQFAPITETPNNIPEKISVFPSSRTSESENDSIPVIEAHAMIKTSAPGIIPMRVASAKGSHGSLRNHER
jgi:hypothetical protein